MVSARIVATRPRPGKGKQVGQVGLDEQGTGALHGVPFAAKDIYDAEGLPTTAGYPPLARNVAKADAFAVARMKTAGAVLIGKTVTTQFASGDPLPTRNPWRTDRTPGGSSSGSGAAVAARLVPIALPPAGRRPSQ